MTFMQTASSSYYGTVNVKSVH